MVGCSDKNDKITTSTEGGYYFDVYAKGTKDVPREGIIELETFDQGVVVEIENGGKAKEFSVQVFVDYKQIDVTIDDEIYNTYIFESPEMGLLSLNFISQIQ